MSSLFMHEQCWHHSGDTWHVSFEYGKMGKAEKEKGENACWLNVEYVTWTREMIMETIIVCPRKALSNNSGVVWNGRIAIAQQ